MWTMATRPFGRSAAAAHTLPWCPGGERGTGIDAAPLAVVGAGPAGLFATFYAGLRGIPEMLFESLAEPGGQLTALYPEKTIYDVAGFPEVTARELVERLWRQAQAARPEVHLEEPVEGLAPCGDGYELATPRGRYRVHGVVIAAGIGRFAPNRLGRPEVDGWEGRGLHYRVPDRAAFAGCRCLVIGGGDSAVDWALHLAPVARSVTVVHRRDRLRAHEGSVEAARAAGVAFRLSAEVVELTGGERVSGAVLRDARTGETEKVDCDAVVAALGYAADLSALAGWGVRLTGRTIPTDAYCQTNLPRVYAVGDIAEYPGKLRLIATAFAEAALAVSAFRSAVDPASSLQPPHSTSRSPRR